MTEQRITSRKNSLLQQVKKLLSGFDGLYEMSDEQAKKKKYGGGVTMYYFKEMGDHPAETYLQNPEKLRRCTGC